MRLDRTSISVLLAVVGRSTADDYEDLRVIAPGLFAAGLSTEAADAAVAALSARGWIDAQDTGGGQGRELHWVIRCLTLAGRALLN